MDLPVNYEKIHYRERKAVREEYIKVQNGLCYYCKAPLTEEPTELVRNLDINDKLFPESFFKNPVHLHHSHDTGMTIGAVHCFCNAVLWQYHGE